jgi:hypothetical protein
LGNSEADVNGVGNDEVITARICDDWRREEGGPDLIEEMIHDRGNAYYYDTPLRIAENKYGTISLGYRYENRGGKAY